MTRATTPEQAVTQVLVRSRRRCALCFGLEHRTGVVKGQVAHVDHNPANNEVVNLVWLCLDHHDQYDSRTSQSKGLTIQEIRHYRADLYQFNETARRNLEPAATYVFLSVDGASLARHLNTRSQHGHRFDPQIRLDALPDILGLTPDEVELAVDELCESGLAELNGSHDVLFATNRLFWETDALFQETDPALDAQAVARVVVAHSHDYPDLKDIAEGLGWTARRLNPAATYLIDAGMVGERPALGTAPYWVLSLIRTPKTKRYVRDLAGSFDAASAC